MLLINKLSVRMKISLSYMLAFVVLVIFMLLFFPAKQKAQTRQAVEDKAASIAKMVAVSIAPAIEFEDERAIQEAFRSAALDPDVQFLAIYDKRGYLFTSYNYRKTGKISSPPDGAVLNGDTLIYGVSVNSAGAKVGNLIVGLSLERINRQINSYRSLIILVGFLILILGGTWGW
ncbi:hypothetical protein DRQ36_08865, partial [bacterium]